MCISPDESNRRIVVLYFDDYGIVDIEVVTYRKNKKLKYIEQEVLERSLQKGLKQGEVIGIDYYKFLTLFLKPTKEFKSIINDLFDRKNYLFRISNDYR